MQITLHRSIETCRSVGHVTHGFPNTNLWVIQTHALPYNGVCLCLSLPVNAYLVPHIHVHMNCNIIKYLIKTHFWAIHKHDCHSTFAQHMFDWLCSKGPKNIQLPDDYNMTSIVKFPSKSRTFSQILVKFDFHQTIAIQSHEFSLLLRIFTADAAE